MVGLLKQSKLVLTKRGLGVSLQVKLGMAGTPPVYNNYYYIAFLVDFILSNYMLDHSETIHQNIEFI